MRSETGSFPSLGRLKIVTYAYSAVAIEVELPPISARHALAVRRQPGQEASQFFRRRPRVILFRNRRVLPVRSRHVVTTELDVYTFPGQIFGASGMIFDLPHLR